MEEEEEMFAMIVNAVAVFMMMSGFVMEPVTNVSTNPYYEPAPVIDSITEEAQIAVTKQLVYDHMKLLGRESEYKCLSGIIYGESKWDPDARGDNGKSWGLVQRHIPVHGLPNEDPWTIESQVEWALKYADQRYGGACPAWKAWRGNIAIYGWGWW